MSSNIENSLLLKEDSFHKSNVELEIRTNELVKEVESVMKLQRKLNEENLGSEDASDSPRRPVSKRKDKYLPDKYLENTFRSGEVLMKNSAKSYGQVDQWVAESGDHSLKISENGCENVDEDNIICEVGKGFGNDGILRFLRGKVKALEDEIEVLHKDYKKRTEDWHHLQSELKKIQDDCVKSRHQATSIKDQYSKLEQQMNSITAKLQQKEGENAALKKESEILKRDLKAAQQSSLSNETRLSRCLDELESHRNVIKQAKLEEKELKELNRKNNEELSSVIRKLERQKVDLMHGFKKQMQLIDNLKKQKAHMEVCRALQFTEEEFMKLLNWESEKK